MPKIKMSMEFAKQTLDILDDFCNKELQLIHLRKEQNDNMAALSNQLENIAEQFDDALDVQYLELLAQVYIIWLENTKGVMS
jgi:hypothetical protein